MDTQYSFRGVLMVRFVLTTLKSRSSSLLGGDVHSGERERQAQLGNVVVVGLGLGQFELGHVGLCWWADSAAQFVEVLFDSVKASAVGGQSAAHGDNVLFVLDLEVLAQVVDIHFEIVYDKRSGCNVGHEIVNVPTRHVVVPRWFSTTCRLAGEGRHTLSQTSSGLH